MKNIGLIMLISFSTFAANFASADVIPVLDIAPEYPQAALRRDISGHVVVRFDVNENGKAHNITIVNASPERIFNDAVRTALRRSTFTVTDSNPSTSFERAYYFDQAAESDLANRFNFMEEAPSLASN